MPKTKALPATPEAAETLVRALYAKRQAIERELEMGELQPPTPAKARRHAARWALLRVDRELVLAQGAAAYFRRKASPEQTSEVAVA